MASSSGEEDNPGKSNRAVESGKYVRYTNEQVEALEKVYADCPKPSSLRRQQLAKEHPALANIEPKQIKVWFQNRRCRERQRLESARLQTMNQKLSALNKLLVEENELATKKISQLSMENALLRQQLSKYESFVNMDSKSNGNGPSRQGMMSLQDAIGSPRNQIVPYPMQDNMSSGRRLMEIQDTTGIMNPIQQQSSDLRTDTNTTGLMQMAEEILAEFLSKATGSSLEYVDLPGLKNGRDSVGRISVATSGPGIAARAAGIIHLPPAKIADILKDRMLWSRDCRRCDVLGGFKTASGGIVELIYTQMYACTTLAHPRDFCTLRYTSRLEDGGMVICERSLSSAHGGASMPVVPSFVRAEMFPSGFLIRPCDNDSLVVVVDHVDLEPWSVPEAVRPLYGSSSSLAQRITIEALRYLRQAAHDNPSGPLENGSNSAPQQTSAWRAIGERIATGFNEAINGFSDDSWSVLAEDEIDDVSVSVRPTQKKPGGQNVGPSGADGPGPIGGGVVCAKVSILVQNVSPFALVRYLREHRSEWADCEIMEAHSIPGFPNGRMVDGQSPLSLSQAVDEREFLELVKLEGHEQNDSQQSRDTFLLQLYSGSEDPLPHQQAQLIFAPVDAASTADTVPLLPSGFRVILLDQMQQMDQSGQNRTLDLASALEGQQESSRRGMEGSSSGGGFKAVVCIAFQFVYESLATRERVALVGRRYVRNVRHAVQSIAMRLAVSAMVPSVPSPSIPAPYNNPEALLLSRRILQSYRLNVGSELVRPEAIQSGDSFLKAFWEHKEAILCVIWKVSQSSPELVFANQAGLEMMDSTLANLSEVHWDKSYENENSKPTLATITQVLQMGFVHLPPGIRVSRTGRSSAYERSLAWKVVDEDNNLQCIAFMHMNWSFLM